MHRDVSEGNIMISRDPKSSRGYLQDFDYGLNWKKLLSKLDLQPEQEDWASFVEDEWKKIRGDLVDDTMARFFAPLTEPSEDTPAGGSEGGGQGGGDDQTDDVNVQIYSDITSSAEEQQDAEGTRDAERSLGTGDDPSAADDYEVEAISGVKITIGVRQAPQVANNEPPTAEEVKRWWKQRTVRILPQQVLYSFAESSC